MLRQGAGEGGKEMGGEGAEERVCVSQRHALRARGVCGHLYSRRNLAKHGTRNSACAHVLTDVDLFNPTPMHHTYKSEDVT